MRNQIYPLSSTIIINASLHNLVEGVQHFDPVRDSGCITTYSSLANALGCQSPTKPNPSSIAVGPSTSVPENGYAHTVHVVGSWTLSREDDQKGKNQFSLFNRSGKDRDFEFRCHAFLPDRTLCVEPVTFNTLTRHLADCHSYHGSVTDDKIYCPHMDCVENRNIWHRNLERHWRNKHLDFARIDVIKK